MDNPPTQDAHSTLQCRSWCKSYLFFFFYFFQALAPQKVDRDAYDGAVASVVDTTDGGKGDATTPVSVAEEAIVPKQSVDQFHQRPPTRSGGRNMQESSFSFSGKFVRLGVDGCRAERSSPG